MLGREGVIGSCRIFISLEPTEVVLPGSILPLSLPLLSGPRHAAEATGTASARPLVALVILPRRIAQITGPVVLPVTVVVIHLSDRPEPIREGEYDTMRKLLGRE